MGRPVPGVLLLLLLVLLGLVSHDYATQFESDYEDRIVSSPTTTEFATTSLRARSSPSFYQGPQCPEHGVRGPPFLVNRRADVPTSSTCERNRSHGFTKPRGCLARRRERPLRVTAASGQTLSQGPHADKVRSPHFFGRWATRFGPPACTGLLFAGFSDDDVERFTLRVNFLDFSVRAAPPEGAADLAPARVGSSACPTS